MVEPEPTAVRPSGKRKLRVNLSASIASLRKAAIERGERYYDPMEPCRFGHRELRYTKGNECVECLRQTQVQKRGNDPSTARRPLRAAPGEKPNGVRREEARSTGALTFVSAVPCSRCGTLARTVTSNNCIACSRARNRERNKNNAPAHRAAVKAWKLANPERVAENHQRWYSQNTEEVRARAAQFADTNRALVRSYKGLHRARGKGAEIGEKGPLVAFFARLLQDEAMACYWCKADVPVGSRTADHIIPLEEGGPHSAGNVCVSCPTCNAKKNRKLPEEFAGQAELRLA